MMVMLINNCDGNVNVNVNVNSELIEKLSLTINNLLNELSTASLQSSRVKDK